MTELHEVPLRPLRLERFGEVLPPPAYARLVEAMQRSRRVLADRGVWSVNSTGAGGGVAEMLRSLMAYAQGAGVDAHWAVIAGDPDFYRVTKRIHNFLHGWSGDGGGLGAEEREIYERTSKANAAELTRRLGRHDIVVLHDPQTAGLIPALRDAGHLVVWRCHVGVDHPNELVRTAWCFLLGDVRQADATVFTRQSYVWEDLDPSRVQVIAPCIDAFSPKNQDMSPATVAAILRTSGLGDGAGGGAEPRYALEDGTGAVVRRRAELSDCDPLRADDPLVAQVSRWDRLKDPVGVIEGFVAHIAPRTPAARLMLAGPAVAAVGDDPEGAEVLRECHRLVEQLPEAVRRRICLASIPMEDSAENAAIINAIQRRADVVVQKSLAEGFGLTVAEAMWKSRPVVASRVGGIQDQIEPGESGVLLDDPCDLAELGDAVVGLLDDPARAARIGGAARRRVLDHYLGSRDLGQFLLIFESLLRARV